LSRAAVLVVTNEQDIGADYLVRELDQRGASVVRLNSERAPEWRLRLRPGSSWHVARGERALSSHDCVGVWWRRPEMPEQPQHLAAAAEAIGDQWRTLLRALATVPGPTWVSNPLDIGVAESKALQLLRAGEVGLAVPETLWTNDADEARAFIASCGGVAVVKSVATAWWENDGEGHFVFASTVSADEIPTEGLANAPVCLQRAIDRKRDIRVTVIEDVVLAAVREEAAAEDDEPLDWRRARARPWTRYQLPPDIEASSRALVRGLGLRFSGIDFALDEPGKHWFLELNANGEWGWLQEAGLPIAEALADTLLSERR